MNFLVIGSGAREHIIAEKLSESGSTVYSVLTNLNPGLLELSAEHHIVTAYNSQDSQTSILDFAKENSIHCVVIGPEDPLANGMADVFWKHDIPVVGPTRQLAQIETSKGFTRDLLEEYNIDASPRYKRFKIMNGASEFIDTLGEDYVIKFDGLMGGKGVKVAGEHLHSKEEALIYCKQLVDGSGTYIIEEKIFGEEFSLMSFCDGENLSHMPAVQDHKRAYENDTGPNTGGMGTYTDSNHSLPFLTNDDVKGAMEINKSTIKALSEKFSEEYKGVLYGGFIATADGVKLIEYNARFGDPEAMNVLSLIETDFIDICVAITDGTLDEINVQFNRQATVCKYVVPEGYPNNPVKGQAIDISEVTDQDNLYYASVDLQNKKLIECGSRTIAIVGIANSIPLAEALAENNAKLIKGPLFHREDIGKDFLIQKRVNNMKLLR